MMLRIPHKFSASAWKTIDMCITTFCICGMRQNLQLINVLQVIRPDAHRINITPSFFRQMMFCRLRYNREFTAHLCMILFHGRTIIVTNFPRLSPSKMFCRSRSKTHLQISILRQHVASGMTILHTTQRYVQGKHNRLQLQLMHRMFCRAYSTREFTQTVMIIFREHIIIATLSWHPPQRPAQIIIQRQSKHTTFCRGRGATLQTYNSHKYVIIACFFSLK